MMHTILKFFKCRWFILHSIAYFSACKKPLNFWKFERNCRCQNERKRSVFRKFLSILRLTRMPYIIYIKKVFDWSKSEYLGITFLQVGELCLHKLCQSKHFGTARTTSPNSKRKTFSCFLSIILFNH